MSRKSETKNNQEILSIVNEILECATILQEELEQKLENIADPNKPTNDSKRKTIEKLRLINGVIDSGLIAKASVEQQVEKTQNPHIKTLRRKK